MSIKPLDSYIKNSVRVFEANPSETIFTITYKPSKEEEKKENHKKNRKPSVSFKTHNNHLDTNYKFETNKSKDVSRLLNALGPRGVSIIPSKIERQAMKKKTIKTINKDGNVTKTVKRTKKSKIVDTIGISSLIVNSKVKEYKPEQNTQSSTNTDKNNKKKGNNKKNKNKKKR
ncbi:similar to Saccharomyces cerevisiae YKL122C SRP21 Subunit of the signal recognition particle (SRP), which functions in protein targeting to the endoplasmic reticulum membrane [Maudiozyma barnettii]|uniref:Similar to Saccharomyces cerevisiae YKL122C SRP21 Subunit of the signal recognition particle (SRP), which functions in protein targeting to the endoplasmic reticulum membrane n=1 Tax=Maudiozyma barnettii TaxID=61262 RepID=A0A8H2VKJ1_9SACH|nr:signal recognition particle subunit SRP21 [Kazachstania barnettii]CAB4257136.1 similar to Saccharomyces cerevisiae YKL122C SRP21 Subunit of the signal recognition particle (SRP), which functions in protein targeting to the endoplasmic reticulum membrane [Kazachstania barnettii]CAD1779506.1 similar to Saccharomyces cerevisiae YKL122C SRP21 Subunit of the signal recognition particle (SRP), which functions in protein targeting to the endoplasmic reticulum membrane [Kazachstania barnettii]